jgi:hypothetical protein
MEQGARKVVQSSSGENEGIGNSWEKIQGVCACLLVCLSVCLARSLVPSFLAPDFLC